MRRSFSSASRLHHGRLIDEGDYHVHRSDLRYPDPTHCLHCGAVFKDGRWQWAGCPAGAKRTVCPACRRLGDAYPVGFLHLSGEYFLRHEQALLSLLADEAERETSCHPIERIMANELADGGVLITTTGFHLARRLGETLRYAHQGELEVEFCEAEDRLRVYWRR